MSTHRLMDRGSSLFPLGFGGGGGGLPVTAGACTSSEECFQPARVVKGANKKPLFSVSVENLTIGFKAQEDKQGIIDFCVSFPLPHAQTIKIGDA